MACIISSLVQSNIEAVKRQLGEYCLFLFVHTFGILTFIYGILLIPEICINWPWPLLLPVYAISFWLFLAVFSHLNLIRLHQSTIKNRLKINISDTPQIEKPSETEQFEFTANLNDLTSTRTPTGTNENEIKPVDSQSGSGDSHKSCVDGETDSDSYWHMCKICKTMVPPKSWHCKICKICILRRDHHCLFAVACIGEDNHCYFLGFLFYMMIGAGYSVLMGFIHEVVLLDKPFWKWLLKSCITYYTVFFDLTLYNLLGNLNMIGCVVAGMMLGFYLDMTMKGQTSVEKKKAKTILNKIKYSWANMHTFLGPKAIQRILFPFYPTKPKIYEWVQKNHVIE